MKKTLLLIGFLIINGQFMFSQEIEVVTGLSHPLGIAINGNDLFICEHGGNGGAGSGFISKADLSVTNPTKVNLLSDLTYPRAICLVGDDLYYYASGGRLKKIDINDSEPTPIDVAVISSVYAIALVNNYLYIGNDQDRIYRLDITDPSATLEIVLDEMEDRVLALTLKGEELYFGYSNKVGKINITDENPEIEEVITGLETNVYSLAFYENTLLIGLSLSYKIVKVDLDADVLEVEDFINLTSIRQPGNLLVQNDELYVAGGRGNLVFKIENLSDLLSVENSEAFITKRIYPNPSNDFIYISRLKEITPYKVYNSNGSLVLNGSMLPSEYIDISSLSSGIYYINLKNESQTESPLKVIKE